MILLPRAVIRVLPCIVVSALPAQSLVRSLPLDDRPLSIDAPLVYRVGGADASAWASFGETLYVGFDGTGRLYVVDRAAARGVILSAEGALLVSFGRKGAGPGEFQIPSGIAVSRSGEFAVTELFAQSISLFDGAGRFQRSARFDASRGLPPSGLVTSTDGATLIATARIFWPNGANPSVMTVEGLVPVTREPITRYWIDRIDAAGDSSRVQFRGLIAPLPPPTQPLARHAFATRMLWAVRPGGELVVVDSSDYRIRRIGPDGVTRAVITRPIAPRRPSAADRDRARAEHRSQLFGPDGRPRIAGAGAGGAGFDARKMAERAIEAMTFASEIPVIRELGADHEGRIWVRRVGPSGPESDRIDLLDGSDHYLGTFRASELAVPAAFGPNGLMAFIGFDEDGARAITVRRLVVRP